VGVGVGVGVGVCVCVCVCKDLFDDALILCLAHVDLLGAC
jgi:hypothetical protein